jgi:hypothetical protein
VPPLISPAAPQATGPPLRPQGSLPRSLRDGSTGPPVTPETSATPQQATRAGPEACPKRAARHHDPQDPTIRSLYGFRGLPGELRQEANPTGHRVSGHRCRDS